MSSYPQTSDERRQIVEDIQRRSEAEGRSMRSVAREYGISIATYHNWNRALRKQPEASIPAFRPVAVTALVPASKPTALSVVTPAGYRVEGLTIEDAAKLLRALG